MQAQEQERQKARDAWIDRLENSQPSHLDSAPEQHQNSPPMSPIHQRSRAAQPDLFQQDESSMTRLHHGRAAAAATVSSGAALPDRRGADEGMRYGAQPSSTAPGDPDMMSPDRLAAMQTAAGKLRVSEACLKRHAAFSTCLAVCLQPCHYLPRCLLLSSCEHSEGMIQRHDSADRLI